MCLSAHIFLTAHPVGQEAARQKALTFVQHANKGAQARRGKSTAPSLRLAMNDEALYVFNIGTDEGFVIVSGDDRMPEVLGYAYTGTFCADSLPENLQAWLNGYRKQAAYLNTDNAARAVSQQAVADTAISPMLDCQWHQYSPYNNLCPTLGGSPTITGCVATAMGQIMYYHQWPQKTIRKIPAYTTATHHIPVGAIDTTVINWSHIRPNYFTASTSEETDAVATLMQLCGASILMDYDQTGSNATIDTVAYALENYFDYHKDMAVIRKNNYDDDCWNRIIYRELAQQRPVLYSGYHDTGGHAFVIDGYDRGDYFHVNWGWGGTYDGYFLLSALREYTDNQVAVVGIQPPNPDAPQAYAVLRTRYSTLMFYYDNNRKQFDQMPGTITYSVNQKREWLKEKNNIIYITFMPSFADYIPFTLEGWFKNCSQLNYVSDIQNINSSCVTSMESMFEGCSSMKTLTNFEQLETNQVNSMQRMFYNCTALKEIDLTTLNTEKVRTMGNMFHGCLSLSSVNLVHFNTQNVVNMSNMFYDCSSLHAIFCDNENFSTKNVTTMQRMFYNCKKLTYVNELLSHFDTHHVTNMNSMFYNCENIETLHLNNFDTQQVTMMNNMFSECKALRTIYVGNAWSTTNVTSSTAMFRGCSLLTGGNGTVYNSAHTDANYAHTDGGEDNPGYFTYEASTGIKTVMPTQQNTEDNDAAWYTISGIKLKGAPVQKGLYIHHGRKVVK